MRNSGLIYYLVFFSGMAALSWEVIWQLKSSLALGVSAWGTAITLAVTMGGMAVGSLAMGWFLKDKATIRPIRTYGFLEIIIGIAGLLLVYTFQLVENLDTWVYQNASENSFYIYLLGIIGIIGVPALCLGATIPVIGLMARQTKTSIAILYGLNTLGAAIGCLLAAFLFIPLLGVQHTIYLIAGINIIVGIVANIIDAGKVNIQKEAENIPVQTTIKSRAIISFVVFVTGFTTFVLEVAWFRSLTSAFLSTTDAFAIMLASVLIALAFGAKLVPLLRMKNASLGIILGISAILVLLSTPLIERFDLVTYGAHANPINLYGIWFGMTLWCVGLPILFLGIPLPWLLDEQNSTKKWGFLYGLNAFSAILGATLATWILLPTFGFAKTAWLAGILLTITALIIMPQKRRLLIGSASIVALIIAFTFESGVGRTRVQGYFFYNLDKNPEKILAFDEGPNATISAIEYDDGFQLLAINGFVTTGDEIKNKGNSYHYMAWMGHLPMLMHPDPKRALVICFGTGQTANAVRKENPDYLDIVDINEQVYEFAPIFKANESVLEDPRVTPIVMDGRAYVRRTKKTYDVITLEPMPPSFAGVNALYSKEFYEHSRDVLSDDGIIAQWVPFHIIPLEASMAIAKTMQSVFPNSILWIDPKSTTGILVGSKNENINLIDHLPGYARTDIDRTLTQDEVKDTIYLDPELLKKYAEPGQIISDNNQLLAYGRLLLVAHNVAPLDDQNHDYVREIYHSEQNNKEE